MLQDFFYQAMWGCSIYSTNQIRPESGWLVPLEGRHMGVRDLFSDMNLFLSRHGDIIFQPDVFTIYDKKRLMVAIHIENVVEARIHGQGQGQDRIYDHQGIAHPLPLMSPRTSWVNTLFPYGKTA